MSKQPSIFVVIILTYVRCTETEDRRLIVCIRHSVMSAKVKNLLGLDSAVVKHSYVTAAARARNQ